jgi:signal peptidase I
MTELDQYPSSPQNPEPLPATPAPPARLGWWRGWVRPCLIATLVLLGFRSIAIDWNVVPSGSMRPTILEGDYILVNKAAYDLKVPFVGTPLVQWSGPNRGDIVVFNPPGESDRYVKRVVGVGGDRLELRDNQLSVNGSPAGLEPLDAVTIARLRESLQSDEEVGREDLPGRTHAVIFHPERPGRDSFGPLVVPEGQYFMMGDNRDDSRDSRYFGFVPRERIAGRVWSVGVSVDPLAGPRWQRFFLALS